MGTDANIGKNANQQVSVFVWKVRQGEDFQLSRHNAPRTRMAVVDSSEQLHHLDAPPPPCGLSMRPDLHVDTYTFTGKHLCIGGGVQWGGVGRGGGNEGVSTLL